jgi:hypothetical protein
LPHPFIPTFSLLRLRFSSAYVDFNNHVEYTENATQCGKTLHKQDVTIHPYFSFGTIRASVSLGQESILPPKMFLKKNKDRFRSI